MGSYRGVDGVCAIELRGGGGGGGGGRKSNRW
jgi:hypothetical protein